jgi:ribA/ribD-fused uncharacterized protein
MFPDDISDFHVAQFQFLSNFYPLEAPIDCHDLGRAATAEHYYQALKTTDPAHRRAILGALTPGRAKRLGRRAPLREGWDAELSIETMRLVLRRKFPSDLATRNGALSGMLIATGDAQLTEGNRWHDQFWGSCTCPDCIVTPGRNQLGHLLMERREQLRAR